MNQIMEKPGGTGTDKDNVSEVTSNVSLLHAHSPSLHSFLAVMQKYVLGLYNSDRAL